MHLPFSAIEGVEELAVQEVRSDMRTLDDAQASTRGEIVGWRRDRVHLPILERPTNVAGQRAARVATEGSEVEGRAAAEHLWHSEYRLRRPDRRAALRRRRRWRRSASV